MTIFHLKFFSNFYLNFIFNFFFLRNLQRKTEHALKLIKSYDLFNANFFFIKVNLHTQEIILIKVKELIKNFKVLQD